VGLFGIDVAKHEGEKSRGRTAQKNPGGGLVLNGHHKKLRRVKGSDIIKVWPETSKKTHEGEPVPGPTPTKREQKNRTRRQVED